MLAIHLAACAADVVPATESVVYGVDDRSDWFAYPDVAFRDQARASSVALIPFTRITLDGAPPSIDAPTLEEAFGVCRDQRFVDQPTASSCSGTLIDEDLVVTAGHCAPTEDDCRSWAYVFDYHLRTATDPPSIERSDVYFCRRLVVTVESSSGGRVDDYAIVQLDRAVDDARRPVAIAAQRPQVGDPLRLVGYGSGLPLKISGGAQVTAIRSQIDYFEASLDAFGGDSGGGVFDAEGDLVGVLVRGNEDYVPRGSCAVVNTLSSPGADGAEAVSYVERAVDALCAQGWPSTRLCGESAACGDELCTGRETSASCPADCAEQCGNGSCGPGEAIDCVSDCVRAPPVTPAAWRCPPNYYGTADGCDCDCGAPDPDCEDPREPVLHCAPGEMCDRGLCSSPAKKASCTVAIHARSPGMPIGALMFTSACCGPAYVIGARFGRRDRVRFGRRDRVRFGRPDPLLLNTRAVRASPFEPS